MLQKKNKRAIPLVVEIKPDGSATAKVVQGAAPHVHGPGCKHDHDHGHGHGHDHGHHHHHHEPYREKPQGTRPGEDGRPAIQLDLEAMLPGETDEQGRFEQLEAGLRAHAAVVDAHIRSDADHRELCVHYDPARATGEELLHLAREASARAAKRYLTKSWFVRGMDSDACAKVVEHAIGRMEGVLSASVAYASERLVVEYDRKRVSPVAIEKRAEAVGYELEEPESGRACSHHGHGGGLSPKLEMPLSVAAGVLITAGLVVDKMHLAAEPVPTALYAMGMFSGGLFAMRGALQSLRQLRLDIETLTVLAAVSAAFLGAWFEGAFLLFLFSLGHAVEHRAMERARRAVDALGKLRPNTARVRRGAEIVEVPVKQVRRGDRLVVRPGDRVPLDGVVREGRSALDQAAITGESVPVSKGPGDEVFCGTINTEAALEVEVTKLSNESVLARVVDLVMDAEARKGKGQLFARKVERRFVPVVLALVPVVALVHVFGFGLSVQEALLRAVSVLVAASPCALAISVPAAVLSAVAAAARGGVLMKGGAHLEALANVRSFAFDKTGTLTEGKPRLVEVRALVDEALLLGTAAGAEALSAHPLAKAVVDGAKDRGHAPLPASALEAVHGKGLKAVVDGDPVAIGSLALFEGEAVPESVRALVDELEGAGKTTMVVQRAGRFLGVLGVADTPRPEAKEALAALRRLGVGRTLMLSGDNARVARQVGAQLGVDHVEAPLMPAGKVEALQGLVRDGGVAMVGDGVNDAPALAAASVGVAMGGAGSDVALETADVVLMGDDLRRLPFAVELARKASRTIRQNLFVSLGIAAVLIVSSILGITRVSEAVLLHEGGTLIVAANGLLLLRVRPS
jgi:Cd2+/Zn2+-exporting ATPase